MMHLPTPLVYKHAFWFLPALIIAVINDLLDLGVIGSVPIVGDAFDGIALVMNFFLIGKWSALGLVEFLPIVVTDVAPTHTIAVLIAFMAYMARPKR